MALDIEAVNLAKAIRQHETGNRPLSGGSGESGRYQFMPATWQSWAGQVLGDPNAPQTLENENKVAYTKIKGWKDQGYNPAQIASMWNSGSPQWEGKVGVNSMGVKYDVPSYVKNVYANYEKLKAQTPKTETVIEPIKKEKIKAEDVAVGAGKGVISTLTGMSSLGERLLRGTTKALLPKSLESKFGVEGGLQQTSAEELVPEVLRTPQTRGEHIGYTGEQLAEFLIPGGASTKIGKVAETVATRIPKLSGLGARAASEAAIFGGQTALQRGKVDEEAKTAAILGAALPVGGAILGKTVKTVGEGVSQVLGRTTGAGESAIKEAFNNPNVIKFARQAGAEGVENFQKQAVSEARNALNVIKQNRGNAYKAELEKIKLNPAQFDGIMMSTRDTIKKNLDNYGIKVTPVVDETGKTLNKFDFSKSTITEKENVIERAFNDVLGWTDNSAAGLDVLKKRLGDYIDQTTFKTPARAILTDLQSNLTKSLKENIKGYEQMTSKYAEASNLISDIEKALSLGGKAQVDTAIRKLMSTMRQNNEFRKELLTVLQEAGGKDIMGKIAGSTLASYTPRGLAGTLSPGLTGGGIAATIMNPASWPLLAFYLASSSPKLVAEFINLISKITTPSGKLLGLTPAIKTQLERIFGEAQNVSKKETKKVLPKLEKATTRVSNTTSNKPSAIEKAKNTVIQEQPVYYRATEDGKTLGVGTKWAWLNKTDAENWAKRNNAKVVEFTVPDSAIDQIDLSRIKKGSTDRFQFDTSKASVVSPKGLSKKPNTLAGNSALGRSGFSKTGATLAVGGAGLLATGAALLKKTPADELTAEKISFIPSTFGANVDIVSKNVKEFIRQGKISEADAYIINQLEKAISQMENDPTSREYTINKLNEFKRKYNIK